MSENRTRSEALNRPIDDWLHRIDGGQLRLPSFQRGRAWEKGRVAAVAIRGRHHRDLGLDADETHGLIRPRAFDLGLALELHTELGEEGDGGIEAGNDDGDVVHPLNRHGVEHKPANLQRTQHFDTASAEAVSALVNSNLAHPNAAD